MKERTQNTHDQERETGQVDERSSSVENISPRHGKQRVFHAAEYHPGFVGKTTASGDSGEAAPWANVSVQKVIDFLHCQEKQSEAVRQTWLDNSCS